MPLKKKKPDRRFGGGQNPGGGQGSGGVQGSVNVTTQSQQLAITATPPTVTAAPPSTSTTAPPFTSVTAPQSTANSAPPTLSVEEQKAQRLEERKARNADRQAKLDLRKENQARWDKASLNLPGFPTVRIPPDNSKRIKGNSFRVTVRPDLELRRYTIVLGEIDGSEPTNKALRRKWVEILFAAYSPTAIAWASDYVSTIISVGRLYTPARWPDEVNDYSTPHARSQPAVPGEALLQSSIRYHGPFRLSNLHALVTHQNIPATYLANDDLSALNIISWRNINVPNWAGTRVGKKFFPTGAPSQNIYNGDRASVIYELRTGFFTSMRPADGQVLLNVSATTSAFYPGTALAPLLLQTWIQRRWDLSNGRMPRGGEDDFNELKGLKVCYLLNNPTTRQWSVFGVSALTVRGQTFMLNGQTQSQTVLNYMTASKYQILRHYPNC